MIQFVLSYGHSEFTRLCIESIYRNTPPEEVNLVVWQNRSGDLLAGDDVDAKNTVLLNLDKNYGCSHALNAMVKVFGLGFGQDVMYISNDHYLFPGWTAPLRTNPSRFQVISPMHPYGLHSLHNRLRETVDFKDSLRARYLDHPESRTKILEYLHLIYGADLAMFIRECILPMEEVACTEEFWAGCFFLSRSILSSVSPFRTDRGLASDEDVLWYDQNIRGQHSMGVYSRCYAHHFQSITTNRSGLSMDHEVGEFSRGAVPDLTDEAQDVVQAGVRALDRILSRRSVKA